MTELTLNEHRVPAGDIELNVTEIGEGPALVWLHGAGPGATGMSNFRANLSSFEGRRNLVFDLPRFGKSDKPTLSIEKGEMFGPYAANTLAQALANLEVETCDVIGNSMGGATAIKLAADNPELVNRLILMAAAGTAPAGWDGGVPPGLMKIAEWMHAGPSESLIREFAELQVYDPSILTDELLAERLAGASDPEVVKTNPLTNALPGDLNPDMPNVKAPTLMLWGREDNFIPLEWGLNAVRSIPNAELRVIPHCGHWVQFEKPELFNQTVATFLEEN